MVELTKIKCVGCEGGVPRLAAAAIDELIQQVPAWQVDQQSKMISRRFEFKGFYKTMSFVNAIAWIANQEGHHPDLEVGYNYCLVKFTTHAVNGLTQNDFICAAKIDALGVA
jgi:4a-hydroxytetrahydrobiopterin dehydratase